MTINVQCKNKILTHQEAKSCLQALDCGSSLYQLIQRALITSSGIVTLSNGWKIANFSPEIPLLGGGNNLTLTDLQSSFVQLQNTVKEMIGKELERKKTLTESAQTQIQGMVATMDSLIQRLEQTDGTLNKEIEQKVKEKISAEQEKDNKQKELKNLETELAGRKNRLQQTEKAVQQKQTEINDVQHKIDEQNRKKKEATSIKSWDPTVFLRKPPKEWPGLAQFNALIAELDGRRDRFKRERDKLKGDLERLRREVQETQHQIQIRREKINSSQGRIKSLDEEIKNKNGKIKELGRDITSLRNVAVSVKDIQTKHKILKEDLHLLLELDEEELFSDQELGSLQKEIEGAHGKFNADFQSYITAGKVDLLLQYASQ